MGLVKNHQNISKQLYNMVFRYPNAGFLHEGTTLMEIAGP